MAMVVNGGMGIWKALSDANLRLYQFNMERGRIILQGAAAQNMEREMAKIDALYDDRKENELEAQINALFDKKTTLADNGARLTSALKNIEEAKLLLAEMSSAAISGKSELFDQKLKELNALMGSSTGSQENLSNLVGNRNRGTWGGSSELLSVNGMDIELKSQFLGSDYQIVLEDGSTLALNSAQGTVGDTAFNDLKIVSPMDPNGIGNGAQIQFTNGETDGNGDLIVHTGTLKMGGLQIGNSWMYGQEDTNSLSRDITAMQKEIDAMTLEDEVGNAARISLKQAELDAALGARTAIEERNKTNGKILADRVNQAMKVLDKAQGEYAFANEMVNTTVNGYDASMKDLQRKYDDAAEERLNARTAAREAQLAKMKLLDMKFSLSSTTSATLISGLFNYTDPNKKSSLFDVLSPPS